MKGCDTLLMVGTSFPYSEWLPKEGQARAVADRHRRRMARHPLPDRGGPRRRREGDAARADPEARAQAGPSPGASRSRARSRSGGAWSTTARTSAGDPMNPQRVVWELSQRLPDDAIVSADSGSSTNWFARDLRCGRDNLASLSGTLATMGPGTPVRDRGQARPPGAPGDRPRRRRRLPDERDERADHGRALRGSLQRRRLVICVFNNQDLNQVTWEQRVLSGDPKYPGTQWIPSVPYAQYAELLGFEGIYCEDGDQVGEAWEQALASKRPVRARGRRPTRRSRRCRRTSRGCRRRRWPRRWSRATRSAPA